MASQKLRILVVDDELAIRRFLRTSLVAEGFAIIEAANGEEALLRVANDRPEVVLLDLGLPDMDGIEVTKRLREWTDVPIIIISVRDQEPEKIRALDQGADDYLTKPFGLGELLARIRATVRRVASTGEQPVFEVGDLLIDFSKRTVKRNGIEIQLTPTEYDLLRVLVLNIGKVMTHRLLLKAVWGPQYENETHLLRVHMSNLRQKIEKDTTRPQYIVTESAVGYRFRESPE